MPYTPFNQAGQMQRQPSSTSIQTTSQKNSQLGGTQIRPLNQPIMNFGANGQPEFDQQAVLAGYQNMYPDQNPQNLSLFADEQMQEFAQRYANMKKKAAEQYGVEEPLGGVGQNQAYHTQGAGIGYAPRAPMASHNQARMTRP